jgi:hypothetical protein
MAEQKYKNNISEVSFKENKKGRVQRTLPFPSSNFL